MKGLKALKMQINIKNIHIHTITMVGSLNIGKAIHVNNSSKQIQKVQPNPTTNNRDQH